MSRLTIYLARLTGVFAIIAVAVVFVRGSGAVMAAIADPQAMFLYGLISLGLGLAMVLGHNVWSGGALPVAVTVVGWLIFVKGLMLLLVTPPTLQAMLQKMDYAANGQLYLIPALLLGIYLTWAGFAKTA